ncbi:MAG: hypothetical protein IJ860_04170, partial [Eubacterium sp.]|nr:hypothetical protein [Eubacterium sp.]
MNQRNRLSRGRLLKSCLLCLAILFAAVPAALLPARAVTAAAVYNDSDPDDYITERFDVTIDTTVRHVFHVREEIDVDFIQPHHGIERYIPFSSKLYEIRHLKVEG